MLAVKRASAVHRCISDQLTVLTVWLFFIMYPGEGHESFTLMKAWGFTLVVVGVVYFNEFVACRQELQQEEQELVTKHRII
jgi:hypothetical protein